MKQASHRSRYRAAIVATAALLAACAVGPDYRAPEAPAASAYTEKPQPSQTEAAPVRGGEAQSFEPGAEISAEWWKLFGSPALDKLMQTALAGHPTLDAAQAALRQAEENLNAQYSVLYPSVDAGLSARRQRISGATFGNPSIPSNVFNLYNASVNVSYAIDLAGGARRELEALESGIDFQRFQLEAAYLSLTANIATTAFREAALREQIRATREILALQERGVQLVEKQFAIGAVSRADVLAQMAPLAATRASVPPLEKALAQTRNQLAVLVGKFPGEAGLPELDLAAFRLPQTLPVSLPADLVRQRPDIRAAEANLHQTNARIGVAQALMFPQLTLSGSYGIAAVGKANLFDPGTQVWNIGCEPAAADFPRRRAAGEKARRHRGLRAGFRTVPADGTRRVPERGGRLARARVRRGHAQGAGGGGDHRSRKPGSHSEAVRIRLDELSRAASRAAPVRAGEDRSGAGAGCALCGHRCALPGARRRVVAARRGGSRSAAYSRELERPTGNSTESHS